MKKLTGVDELQFWTAAAIGAREIERRAVAELVRITGAKLEKRRTVTGRAKLPTTTTEAKRKDKTEWTPERRAEQGKRARKMWRKRRAAAKKTRVMSAAG